jgi:hypothetical protein
MDAPGEPKPAAPSPQLEQSGWVHLCCGALSSDGIPGRVAAWLLVAGSGQLSTRCHGP